MQYPDDFIDKIICADQQSILPLIPDNSVAMTLTDIPYAEVTRPSNGLRKLDKGAADILTFPLEPFVEQLVRITAGSIYIFCSTEQCSSLRSLLIKHGLSTRLCLWEKTNPSPMNGQYIWLSSIECCVFGKKSKATFNEHCKSVVWRFPCGRSKVHPTEKPLKLFEYLVGVSSNPGDIILDPCIGSGTTAVAAKSLGRKCIGIEMSPEYHKMAIQRMNDHKTTVNKNK